MNPEMCDGELEGSIIDMSEEEYKEWKEAQEARKEEEHLCMLSDARQGMI